MEWTIEETDPHSDAWRSLLDATPHLLFHEPVWAQVVAEGVSPYVVCALLKRNGQVMSGAVGFVIGAPGFKIGYFGYPYGGIIGLQPDPSTNRALWCHFAKQRSLCQLQFVDFPGGTPVNAAGMLTNPDTTHIVDLVGITKDALWNGYRRSRRQDIRKAREKGVVVKTGHSTNDVRNFYALYLETMQRSGGIARYRQSLVQAIVDHVASIDRARLLLAYVGDQLLAGMLVVNSEHLVHGLILASSDRAHPYQPNKVLLHMATEIAIDQGQQGFDFMPSGKSTTGVGDFKKLWGANAIALRNGTLPILPIRSRLWRTAYGLAGWQPFRRIIALARRWPS